MEVGQRSYAGDQLEQEDASLRKRSLLYVAATRARDGLVMSWSGKPLQLLRAWGGVENGTGLRSASTP